ncbi:unnamed protein product [Polarella glacialis]|uniref:Uncharacterized protein n=1 Tax=Polarella glacialis TaxID=89957 RepID=A0A813G1J3_POLGL|nr:unnamed protein product [Polarella glacialis]
MASTVRSTWESSTVGSETPPAGQTRGLGDRTRASLGGGAAVADAISSVVGAGGSRASTADSEKLPKDEVRRKEEESPEEVKRDMRKPLGKLPSLGVVGAGAAGKDLLPPMRSSGLSPSNSGNRSEEVSLGEGRGASKSGDALDEAVASGTLSSPTQQAGTATSRKLLGGIGTSAMAALAGSALAVLFLEKPRASVNAICK